MRHDFHDVFFFGGSLLVATGLAGVGRDWKIPTGGLAVLLVVFMVASGIGAVNLVDPLPGREVALGTVDARVGRPVPVPTPAGT